MKFAIARLPKDNSDMNHAVPEILAAALSLPEGDRANIAYELLASLKTTEIWSHDDPEFGEELQRRLDAHERDPSAALDLEDVSQRVRQALAERLK
jgi:putative addiction module component (TIGR02574 family)